MVDIHNLFNIRITNCFARLVIYFVFYCGAFPQLHRLYMKYEKHIYVKNLLTILGKLNGLIIRPKAIKTETICTWEVLQAGKRHIILNKTDLL